MPKFSIEVRFMGGLNAAQQAAFSNAAKRWAQVVIGDFPSVNVDGEVINALVIEASGKDIDGEGNILGQSSPTVVLPNGLPAKGFMEFDTSDLAEMENGIERLDLLQQAIGQLLAGDDGQAGNVIDRLFGIELCALAADLVQNVDHVRFHVEQSELEHCEQPAWSRANDEYVGLDRFSHSGSRDGVLASTRAQISPH